MSEILSIMPLSFWVVMALLIGGGIRAFQRRNDGSGLPVLGVLGTVAAWYVGDAFYNDYANYHAKLFTAGTLAGAWLEVAWFLMVFLLATPVIHRAINARHLNRRSGVMQLFQHGIGDPLIQRQLNVLFQGCTAVWFILLLIAILKLKGEVIYYLFPYLDHRANPWTHGQIGMGLDYFSILAVYMQLLSATMFGVVAALAMDRGIRRRAMLFCLLAWPFFIFDRTRNSMLAMMVPAILCWVFLRLRGGVWKKGVVLLAFFLVINTWMKFVIANRSHTSISAAFTEKGLNLASGKRVRNEGLNMFEELCWISTFIGDGSYRVNWGARYFAELVNPIPRAVWHGKPLIGLDYAIARGHHITGPKGTVDTTVATGMIGQGVVNFGRLFGPVAAALLMSLWVAWLARMDLTIQRLGRLPLYSLGLILTFNLGRDITLITLYPFVFGALAVWWLGRHQRQADPAAPVAAASPTVRTSPRRPRPASVRLLAFARRSTPGGFVKRTPARSTPGQHGSE